MRKTTTPLRASLSKLIFDRGVTMELKEDESERVHEIRVPFSNSLLEKLLESFQSGKKVKFEGTYTLTSPWSSYLLGMLCILSLESPRKIIKSLEINEYAGHMSTESASYSIYNTYGRGSPRFEISTQ